MARTWRLPNPYAKSRSTDEPEEPYFTLVKRVCGQWVRARSGQYHAKAAVMIWQDELRKNKGLVNPLFALEKVKLESDKVNVKGNKYFGKVTLKTFDKVCINNFAACEAAEFKIKSR
jgi:hypothetical protein